MNRTEKREAKERSKEREEKKHDDDNPAGADLDRTLCGTGTKCWNIGITPHVLTAAAEQIGMSFAEVNDWLKYMNDVNWTFGSGAKISWRNFRRSLRMWHVVENHKRYRHKTSTGNQRGKIDQLREDGLKRQRLAAQSRRESESVKPEAWELCRERCAMYNGGDEARCGFCRAGYRTPPQLRERPCPPEECARFAALDGEVIA